MGQLLSSEQDLSEAKDVIGCLIYNAMVENGATPDLCVNHHLFLSNQHEILGSRARLQEHLRQLQGDLGNRAPSYLKDLIGRLSAFSDEPRIAGLVGMVLVMVVEMACSSRRSLGASGKSAVPSSCQRVAELQAVMEEYLKRCQINFSDHSKLTQDTQRLEAQLSLNITQLKACLLGGGCDTKSLKQWASGAVFHTQMLVHLAGLEGQNQPLAAWVALEQYQEDLRQIIPVYRHYKSGTVCVVKCRGGLLGSHDPSGEEGSMTGLSVVDRETGKSVTIPLSTIERESEKIVKVSTPSVAAGPTSSFINLDLITSDQYAQAYLDHLFSAKGPLAQLQNYFTQVQNNLSMLRTEPGSKGRTEPGSTTQGLDGGSVMDKIERGDRGETYTDMECSGRRGKMGKCERRDEGLKLNITETEPS